jgi:transcriptional regulator with XRE-family HTH domain
MEHNDRRHTPSQAIARHLRALRKRQGMTAAQLAAAMTAAGIPWERSTVAKLENGHRQAVTIDEAVALVLVLDVTMAELLGVTGSNFEPDELGRLDAEMRNLEASLRAVRRRAARSHQLPAPPEQEDDHG